MLGYFILLYGVIRAICEASVHVGVSPSVPMCLTIMLCGV